eukprot:CAMPEP_0181202954 /NCGR_PEP_ID=MMETSP1096-20121128/19125_1 /TAXON_ID=156174 ORGANISM="Chrysochromulina ericina, Strain CCMP281" /NCGR_SAMPLE_ID=MMETSP1096 /ASSEMBLY_ACC=CAM_ASM_000453 /LENGTH=158 /DNA_ID=CAMNT_0023293517 /DNA_START=146 /DNA_END=620 /DNA_ORIENTATION=+
MTHEVGLGAKHRAWLGVERKCSVACTVYRQQPPMFDGTQRATYTALRLSHATGSQQGSQSSPFGCLAKASVGSRRRRHRQCQQSMRTTRFAPMAETLRCSLFAAVPSLQHDSPTKPGAWIPSAVYPPLIPPQMPPQVPGPTWPQVQASRRYLIATATP